MTSYLKFAISNVPCMVKTSSITIRTHIVPNVTHNNTRYALFTDQSLFIMYVVTSYVGLGLRIQIQLRNKISEGAIFVINLNRGLSKINVKCLVYLSLDINLTAQQLVMERFDIW